MATCADSFFNFFVGEMRLVGEDEVVVMRGSYSYIGADGLSYIVDWVADENGFQASGPLFVLIFLGF